MKYNVDELDKESRKEYLMKYILISNTSNNAIRLAIASLIFMAAGVLANTTYGIVVLHSVQAILLILSLILVDKYFKDRKVLFNKYFNKENEQEEIDG